MTRIYKDNDIVVDIGSGKGRVINYLLHNFPRLQIYGIELDPECASELAGRLRKHVNVKILCGDACDLIPAEASVLYLFNPFNRSVMARFKESIKSIATKNRACESIRILYYNPTWADVFSTVSHFIVEKIKLPSNFHQAVLIKILCGSGAVDRDPSQNACA